MSQVMVRPLDRGTCLGGSHAAILWGGSCHHQLADWLLAAAASV
jgi:hypothetical protein